MVKPARLIAMAVSRLRWQPPIRCGHIVASRARWMRARPAVSARTCSRKHSTPPGLSTRRISASAASWSGTVHSTNVTTAASKLASAAGSVLARPSVTVTGTSAVRAAAAAICQGLAEPGEDPGEDRVADARRSSPGIGVPCGHVGHAGLPSGSSSAAGRPVTCMSHVRLSPIPAWANSTARPLPAGARWPSCSYGAAEQRAEVAPPPLNGGVLVEDLAVDIAPGGKVGSRAVAAGGEGRVGAHHLPGSAVGAAAAGAREDDDGRGRGPPPLTAADRYHDLGAVAGVDSGDPAVPPGHGRDAEGVD